MRLCICNGLIPDFSNEPAAAALGSPAAVGDSPVAVGGSPVAVGDSPVAAGGTHRGHFAFGVHLLFERKLAVPGQHCRWRFGN